MDNEIRARFSGGKIELLEKVDLEEGDEILITVRKAASPIPAKDAFQRAAGAWKGLVDTDALLKDFKDSRKINARDVQL
jgi:predicted DNA-binding antitoxin AbrB/MazE fold protein